MVESKWSERTPAQIFGNSRFYKWLLTIFAEKSHNHTKSQITDFTHTHDDRYFTESEINTKFGWTTVATTSLGGGTQKLDVNSTSRLANYYGNVSVAVTTNVVQLGTLTSGYFPFKTVRQPAHNLTANPVWIIVTNDGKISYRGSVASNGNLTLDWDIFWRY